MTTTTNLLNEFKLIENQLLELCDITKIQIYNSRARTTHTYKTFSKTFLDKVREINDLRNGALQPVYYLKSYAPTAIDGLNTIRFDNLKEFRQNILDEFPTIHNLELCLQESSGVFIDGVSYDIVIKFEINFKKLKQYFKKLKQSLMEDYN